MPLKEIDNVKIFDGDVVAEFEVGGDESVMIKDVRVYNPAGSYATFKINRTTVNTR